MGIIPDSARIAKVGKPASGRRLEAVLREPEKDMLGLWLEAPDLTVRTDLPRPVPGPGEALVRVHLAGICATDLELIRGYASFRGVPGHEFVGEIAAAPAAPQRVGQRVVGEINVGCGDCPRCRAGHPNHCPRRRVLGLRRRHGALAEYLTLPLSHLHPVPEGLAEEAAVFCEPLAAALHLQAQSPLEADERVLLIGAGRLGQLIARTLAPTGVRLQVVARHPRQQQRLEAAGIAWIEAAQVSARAFDRVIEASGRPGGFALACQAVRPRGLLMLKSTYAGSAPLDLSPLVVHEITLIGSRCGAFAPALDWLAHGRLDPRPLIEARYPLSRSIEACARAAQPGTLKVLVDCRNP